MSSKPIPPPFTAPLLLTACQDEMPRLSWRFECNHLSGFVLIGLLDPHGASKVGAQLDVYVEGRKLGKAYLNALGEGANTDKGTPQQLAVWTRETLTRWVGEHRAKSDRMTVSLAIEGTQA